MRARLSNEGYGKATINLDFCRAWSPFKEKSQSLWLKTFLEGTLYKRAEDFWEAGLAGPVPPTWGPVWGTWC